MEGTAAFGSGVDAPVGALLPWTRDDDEVLRIAGKSMGTVAALMALPNGDDARPEWRLQ